MDPLITQHLRDGVVVLLARSMQSGKPEPWAFKLARLLEAECVASSALSHNAYEDYMGRFSGLRAAMTESYGDCLETTIVDLLVKGIMSPAMAVTPKVYEFHTQIGPRSLYRARFYEILAKDARFEGTRTAVARELERGCYNAALEKCNASADSYTKQWNCPMFVNVYSGRCGLVSANLDPTGMVAKGLADNSSWALDRLASGAWLPEVLGAMSAMELCPQAWAAERAQISRRLNQKVEEKTSSLFACPYCHKRNHTYRQIQIGSGDEPSTFMCTCKECGENYEGFA